MTINKIDNAALAKIVGEHSDDFEAFVQTIDDKCWARYDLSAVRVGWHFGREALAREMAAMPGADEIHQRADALYEAGYNTARNERDYDPRGCDEWQAVVDAMPTAPQPECVEQTAAARDVLAERRRQIEAEGFAPHFDDHYNDPCALKQAAGCYLLYTDAFPNTGQPPPRWPWRAGWWKPKDYRRDLVRAAALALAAIEKHDRAAVQEPSHDDQ